MRVVFAAVGGYGHVYPFLPLALAAARAGHQVTVATHEKYHPAVRAVGLATVPVGPTIKETIGEAVRLGAVGPERQGMAFGRLLPRRFLADLRPVIDAERPDLVVFEAYNLGAGLAATLTGTAALCHGIGRAGSNDTWAAIGRTWTATAAEVGVTLPAVAPESVGFPFLDICPPSFQAPGRVQPARHQLLRPVPFSGPGELPALARDRRSGRPLVYLSLGTAFSQPAVLASALRALSTLDADVLATGGRLVPAQELGEVPANVAVYDWLPQADLLPLVDLVVSHGGAGTMLGALAHGRPHLVLPQGGDQFANAQAVVDRGVGAQVRPDEFEPAHVAAVAAGLLNDQAVRARAQAVALEIATMPAPEDIVKQWA